MECEFCKEGPLECDCEDVDMSFEAPSTMEEALQLESFRANTVSKLGRAKAKQLLAELDLDSENLRSWQTLSSMAMWI